MKLLALALVLVVGCKAPATMTKLPAFAQAVQAKPAAEVRCYFAESVDADVLPGLIPYAYLQGAHAGRDDREKKARVIARYARDDLKIAPDLIIFHDNGTNYAGSVSTYWGFGISTSEPIYQASMVGVCYRLAPARAGMRWDETGMIVSLSDLARAAGLLEGDKIVSIAGSVVMFGKAADKSPHIARAMSWHPGEKVEVVWIRPGTGRMSGKVALAENPPIHLQLAPDIDPADDVGRRQPAMP
jgi:hypothetical protein